MRNHVPKEGCHVHVEEELSALDICRSRNCNLGPGLSLIKMCLPGRHQLMSSGGNILFFIGDKNGKAKYFPGGHIHMVGVLPHDKFQ